MFEDQKPYSSSFKTKWYEFKVPCSSKTAVNLEEEKDGNPL